MVFKWKSCCVRKRHYGTNFSRHKSRHDYEYQGCRGCIRRLDLCGLCFSPDFRHRFDNARRSEEHTSELQSHVNLVCRLLLEKKKINNINKVDNQDPIPIPKIGEKLTRP